VRGTFVIKHTNPNKKFMSEFTTLPTMRPMKTKTVSRKEAEKSRQEEIAEIEESMRILFRGYKINQSIVDQYNSLERKWKRLTGYTP